MASIYDKALKRKDFSGITTKDKHEEGASIDSERKIHPEPFRFISYLILVEKSKAERQEEKDKAAKADDPKAGADIGKIVNLMAGDAGRVEYLFFFLFVFL